MSKIADLKKQILEAREAGDIDLEIDLMSELREETRPKVKTVKEAYGQMADSP
jgi:hypothetical protein